MSGQPDVFVLGPARSGPTVLSPQLASRLSLACSPETNALGILNRIARTRRDMTFGVFQQVQLDYLMHGADRPYCMVMDPDLTNRRIVESPRAFVEALIRLDRYSDGESTLEQTPRNGEHLRNLRWLFPEAIIVFVIRNPFDVIQSNRETPWGTKNVFVLFAIWARQNAELIRLFRNYGRARVILVRYERLGCGSYRQGLIERIVRYGVAPRPEAIVIEPRNFDASIWASGHMHKSVGEFRATGATKWTSRHGWLRRLGEGIIRDVLLAARGRERSSWRLWLVRLADWFARRRIRR